MSEGACSLSGHPEVTLVGHNRDGSESARFTATSAEGGFMLSSLPAREVVLPAGGTGFFGIEDIHICPPDGSGPLVPIDQVEVTINGASPYDSPVDLKLSTCSGAGVGAFRGSIRAVYP
jgi:hypothetical protein